MYKNDIWHVDEGWQARDKSPMRRIVGATKEQLEKATQKSKEVVEDAVKKTAENIEEVVQDGSQKVRNKWTKTIIWTGIGIAAAGTAAYAYLKHGKMSSVEKGKDENPKLNSVA